MTKPECPNCRRGVEDWLAGEPKWYPADPTKVSQVINCACNYQWVNIFTLTSQYDQKRDEHHDYRQV